MKLDYLFIFFSFPHNKHDLTIKLGIISKREVGDAWDRKKWKLALAVETDSQKTIRVPHGVIVDHVKIPGFTYHDQSLQFELVSLPCGLLNEQNTVDDYDAFLQVKISVMRDSRYYDYLFEPQFLLVMLYFTNDVFRINYCHFKQSE